MPKIVCWPAREQAAQAVLLKEAKLTQFNGELFSYGSLSLEAAAGDDLGESDGRARAQKSHSVAHIKTSFLSSSLRVSSSAA